VYGTDEVSERHRHRYEVNPEYLEVLNTGGMRFSGLSPDGQLVEIIELPDHPFFLATQFHPELKSRPTRPHPLFAAFVAAAVRRRTGRCNGKAQGSGSEETRPANERVSIG
jgi:CTP synthase